MTAPLVSVILPVRDRAASLGRAIESVFAQTHQEIELIVIDDGSTDDSAAVARGYGADVTVLSQAAAGPYPARNLGIHHASGDLIAFIDSDDAWRPGRLAAQLHLLEDRRTGLVFGDARHVGPGARGRTCFGVTPPARGDVAAHFAWGNFVPTVCVLARRSCLLEAGGFPTSHPIAADYLTWFRIALRHRLDFAAEVLADYAVGGGGISADIGRSLQARIELFSAELAAATVPSERELLRKLVFNLGLHLAIAKARGRVSAGEQAARVMRGALGQAAPADLLPWSAAWISRQARRRAGALAG
jgi:glycosyltransferase involved in cell wall biosynthesis